MIKLKSQVVRLLSWCNVVAVLFALSGCGSDVSTEGWVNPPNQSVTDTNNNWKQCSNPAPSPSPSLTASPDPSQHAVSGWCRTFPWWPGCKSSASDLQLQLAEASQTPTVDCSMHNTKFCQVDKNGNILSGDYASSDQQGNLVHGIGGGCVARPIRELWAVVLNNGAMKPDDVDEYDPTNRGDLVGQMGPRVEFVFDIYNVHHALLGLVNPSWTMRWVHAIPYGTYETPNEVTANFQKIEGTGHIRQLYGGYTLDRVTDKVTSYAMEQWSDADSYGTDDALHDMQDNFGTMRQSPPDWSQLPDKAPVELPSQ